MFLMFIEFVTITNNNGPGKKKRISITVCKFCSTVLPFVKVIITKKSIQYFVYSHLIIANRVFF